MNNKKNKYIKILFLIPLIWMAGFFLMPCLFLLKISFSKGLFASPPYTEIFSFVKDTYDCVINFTLENYIALFDSIYIKSLYTSFCIALSSTLICLIIGYPMAYAISKYDENKKFLLLILVFLPFWTSFLIRIYAWISLLSPGGILNHFLMSINLIDKPINFSNNIYAVCVGIVYSYLPFMILPLYTSIEKLDRSYIDAAYDLGCRPCKTFFFVTIPLSINGIIAGSVMVFLPALGEYLIPELLGGSGTLTLGRVIWNDCFENISWPTSAALGIILVVIVSFISVCFKRLNKILLKNNKQQI